MNTLLRFILITFCGIALTANAQISFRSDSVGKVEIPVPADQINLYNWVVNNSANEITIRWRKVVNDFPGNWLGTSVCDKNLCWGYNVEFENVIIPAGDSTNIDVYFYNDGRSGEGYAEVIVFDIADSLNTVQMSKYYAKADAGVGISDVQTNALTFYPNPATSSITITGIDNKEAVVELYNVLGKLVKATTLNNGQVNVSDLNNGFYIVKVSDETTNEVYTNTFLKK